MKIVAKITKKLFKFSTKFTKFFMKKVKILIYSDI
jgi:hypothetical protein